MVDRGFGRLSVEDGLHIFHRQHSHCAAGVFCGAGLMGGEDDIVHLLERFGDARLVCENIQRGAGDGFVCEGGDEGGLVDEGAASDVDEVSGALVFSEGLKDFGVDDFFCLRGCGGGGAEDVALLREGDGVFGPAMGGVWLGGGGVVGDFHSKRERAMNDCGADAPHSEHSEPPVGEAVGQGEMFAGFPFVFCEVLRGGDFSDDGEHEGERHVGDIVVEDIGGVGDPYAAVGGGVGVNAVVSDAVAGDDFEVGHFVHHLRACAGGDGGLEDGAVLREERVALGFGAGQNADGEPGLQPRADFVHQESAGQQDAFLGGWHGGIIADFWAAGEYAMEICSEWEIKRKMRPSFGATLMSLIDLHKKGELQEKTLAQIITFAGDGKLRDNNATSREFRNLLAHIQLPEIRAYAVECINSTANNFPENGRVLQDIVNQVGKRLGFEVEDGRYGRGTPDAPSYDGVWKLPDKRVIVVESKLNAAFAMDLDQVARYRLHLIASHPVLTDDLVSVLLVAGHGNMGNLAMQIRGSRHAWDMRIISVDALLKIAEIKERVEAPTFRRFHEILVPKEFIRLDEVAELFLSTASEASDEEDEAAQMEEAAADDVLELKTEDNVKKPPFRVATVNQVQAALQAQGAISSELIPRSRTMLSTPDGACGVVCLTSKIYHRGGHRLFWFTLRDYQKKFLESLSRAWVALGCGTEKVVVLFPWEDLSSRLDSLLQNCRGGVQQWHLHIHELERRLVMRPQIDHPDIDLSGYLLDGRD